MTPFLFPGSSSNANGDKKKGVFEKKESPGGRCGKFISMHHAASRVWFLVPQQLKLLKSMWLVRLFKSGGW
jgi:hypothetical protein